MMINLQEQVREILESRLENLRGAIKEASVKGGSFTFQDGGRDTLTDSQDKFNTAVDWAERMGVDTSPYKREAGGIINNYFKGNH